MIAVHDDLAVNLDRRGDFTSQQPVNIALHSWQRNTCGGIRHQTGHLTRRANARCWHAARRPCPARRGPSGGSNALPAASVSLGTTFARGPNFTPDFPRRPAQKPVSRLPSKGCDFAVIDFTSQSHHELLGKIPRAKALHCSLLPRSNGLRSNRSLADWLHRTSLARIGLAPRRRLEDLLR